MPARQPSMTEQKLVILYALDRLGLATENQLLHFMVENELMDYMALRLSVAELGDMGLLREVPHALGALYAPSAKGYETLELFQSRIPHSRITRINDTATDWKRRFRQEKQVLAGMETTPSGEHVARLQLLEGELPLLDVRVSLPTREQASRFCQRWPSTANAFYAHLMQMLGEE